MEFFITYIETLGILDTGIMLIINVTINDISNDVSFWYDDEHSIITYSDNTDAIIRNLIDNNYKEVVKRIYVIIPENYAELSDIVF